MFGSRDEIDPAAHLLGTAAGWGGLPERESYYVLADPKLPVGEYEIKVGDVPVDAFWSLTVYNRDGFLETEPERPQQREQRHRRPATPTARSPCGSVVTRPGRTRWG